MGTGSDGITMTAAVDNQSATPSLRQRIGRAGGRLRPGIGGFLTWWMHALASWMPPRLRMLLGLAPERVLRPPPGERSEERRVGKECVSPRRSRWAPSH